MGLQDGVDRPHAVLDRGAGGQAHGGPRKSLRHRGRTVRFRVTKEQRAPWQASAEAWKLSESEWARGGLDAWVKICDCAAQLGVNPRELVDVALADHVRVRAAIGELARASVRGRRSDG